MSERDLAPSAKPDKIAIGQRWKNFNIAWTVTAVGEDPKWPYTVKSEVDGHEDGWRGANLTDATFLGYAPGFEPAGVERSETTPKINPYPAQAKFFEAASPPSVWLAPGQRRQSKGGVLKTAGKTFVITGKEPNGNWKYEYDDDPHPFYRDEEEILECSILISQPETPAVDAGGDPRTAITKYAVKPGEMVVIDEVASFGEEEWRKMETFLSPPSASSVSKEKEIGPGPSAIPRCTRCNGIHRSSECPPGWGASSVPTPHDFSDPYLVWSGQPSCKGCGADPGTPKKFCNPILGWREERERMIAKNMAKNDVEQRLGVGFAAQPRSPEASPKFFQQSHTILAGGVWSLRSEDGR